MFPADNAENIMSLFVYFPYVKVCLEEEKNMFKYGGIDFLKKKKYGGIDFIRLV